MSVEIEPAIIIPANAIKKSPSHEHEGNTITYENDMVEVSLEPVEATVLNEYEYSITSSCSTSTSHPPKGVPDGGTWGTLKHVGRQTVASGCMLGLVCIPFGTLGIPGVLPFLCPSDEKDAYMVDGKVYDAKGRLLDLGGCRFKERKSGHDRHHRHFDDESDSEYSVWGIDHRSSDATESDNSSNSNYYNMGNSRRSHRHSHQHHHAYGCGRRGGGYIRLGVSMNLRGASGSSGFSGYGRNDHCRRLASPTSNLGHHSRDRPSPSHATQCYGDDD